MKKLDWGAFSLDLLSIVLGIFITFGIQGWIDRSHEKKEVRSALGLVKDELTNNIENLQDALNLIDSKSMRQSSSAPMQVTCISATPTLSLFGIPSSAPSISSP